MTHEEKELEEKLRQYEYPELHTEKEYLHFMYLRACYLLNERPVGDFEGDAKICANIMAEGGDLIAMYRAGANAVYVSCLSTHDFDIDIQRKIIEMHIPF